MHPTQHNLAQGTSGASQTGGRWVFPGEDDIRDFIFNHSPRSEMPTFGHYFKRPHYFTAGKRGQEDFSFAIKPTTADTNYE